MDVAAMTVRRRWIIELAAVALPFGAARASPPRGRKVDVREAGEAVRLAIAADARPDPAHPLRVEEVEILAKDGKRMSGVITLASGAETHPTVLFYHGYPAAAGNRDLEMAIARMGWNILSFHYRGLWGSGGEFSWRHSMEDARSAFDFLTAPDNLETFRVDPARIVLAGHSLGGFLAVHTAATLPDRVKGVAVLTGADLGALGALSRTPDGRRLVMQLGETKAPVSGATWETLITELQDHQEEWSYLRDAAALRAIPVLVVEADDPLRSQNRALAQRLRDSGNPAVTERFIDSDHGFNDKRIALTTVVLTWLHGFQPRRGLARRHGSAPAPI